MVEIEGLEDRFAKLVEADVLCVFLLKRVEGVGRPPDFVREPLERPPGGAGLSLGGLENGVVLNPFFKPPPKPSIPCAAQPNSLAKMWLNQSSNSTVTWLACVVC